MVVLEIVEEGMEAVIFSCSNVFREVIDVDGVLRDEIVLFYCSGEERGRGFDGMGLVGEVGVVEKFELRVMLEAKWTMNWVGVREEDEPMPLGFELFCELPSCVDGGEDRVPCVEEMFVAASVVQQWVNEV